MRRHVPRKLRDRSNTSRSEDREAEGQVSEVGVGPADNEGYEGGPVGGLGQATKTHYRRGEVKEEVVRLGVFERLIIKFFSSKINKFLSGKKTYIAGAGLIVAGLNRIVDGDTVPGVELVLQGFGLMGIRAGISKVV